MKTSPLPPHPSPLTTQVFTDIHCHLLPQIDDGPKDWETSLAMARMAVANGIGTIVATPHQLGRYERNSAEQILQLTAEGQQRITQAGLPLTILPGADVRIKEDLPELVERGQVLTLGLRQNPAILRPWVQQGCLIQVTAGSITGQFGRKAQQASRWLLNQNLVHLVATDAHDVTRRPPEWRQAFVKVCRYLGRTRAKKIFFDNPEAVVQGRPVDAPLPSSVPQTGFAAWFGSALATLRG